MAGAPFHDAHVRLRLLVLIASALLLGVLTWRAALQLESDAIGRTWFALAIWSLIALAWCPTPRTGLVLAVLPLTAAVLRSAWRSNGISLAAARIFTALAWWNVAFIAIGLLSIAWPLAFLGGEPGSGMFGSRTAAAITAAVALPLSSAKLLATRHARGRAFWIAASVGHIVFIASTGVRTAWIAALAGHLATCWIHRLHHRCPRGTLATGIAPLLLLLVLAWIPMPIGPRSSGGPSRWITLAHCASTSLRGERDSLHERALIWRNCLALIAERPWFGYGTGRFAAVYPLGVRLGEHHSSTSFNLERAPRHAHMDVLETWVELGAPGLALITILVMGILLGALRASAAAFGVASAFLLCSFTHFPLFSPAPLVFLTLAAARPPRRRAPEDRPGRHALLLSGLALIPLVPALFLAFQHVSADLKFEQAFAAASHRGDLAQAEGLDRRALALDPESPAKLIFLAEILRTQKRYLAAHQILDRVRPIAPYSLNRLHEEALLLAAEGRLDEARDRLRDFLSIQPASVRAHELLALWAARAAGIEAAAPHLEQLFRAIPWLQRPDLWRLLGRSRLRRAERFSDPRLLRAAESAFNHSLVEATEPVDRLRAALERAEVHLLLRAPQRLEEELLPILREFYPALNSEKIRAEILGSLTGLLDKARSVNQPRGARILERAILELRGS